MQTATEYWKKKVNPKLLPLLAKWPIEISFDSWWKVKLCSILTRIPAPLGPKVASHSIRGVGKYCFPMTKPKSASATAIFWVHGGGRVMGYAGGATECLMCTKLVTLLDIPVLSAEYRRAPRHPFPAPLDDLVVNYKWLVDKVKSEVREEEEVKIIVAGESAGGGLVAELCQRLLDESKNSNRSNDAATPLPIAQMLFEPMLDDRTCVNKDLSQLPSHLVWNFNSNVYGWSQYLGPDYKVGDESLPAYAVASRRKDLSGLPPAWIMVGTLDLFYSESKDYASRLKEHGVPTTFIEIQGGFHTTLALDNMEAKSVLPEIWDSIQEFVQPHMS